MRYVYATLVVALVGGGVWVLFGAKDPTSGTSPSMAIDPASMNAVAVESIDRRTDPKKSVIKNANAASQSPTQIDRSLQARLDAMRQRRVGQHYQDDAVAAAAARYAAWTPTDEIPKSLPLKPEEFSDGRMFIKFDPVKMESLMPGDTLTVQLDKYGAPYLVEIDSAEALDSERVTWQGHLRGIADHYSVIFTRGKSLTVGGLDTPKGHYVLQAHGADGWIATSELLFKGDLHIYPPTDGNEKH